MDNQQATLTTEDLAWLGGIIDGEGCISLSVRTRKSTINGSNKNYRPWIVISNSDPFTINECHRILNLAGIGHWITWRNPSGKDRRSKRMMGMVEVTGYKRVQTALGKLTRFIRAKNDQAKTLSEYIEYRLSLPRIGSYDQVDDGYYNRIKALKQKEAPETIRGSNLTDCKI